MKRHMRSLIVVLVAVSTLALGLTAFAGLGGRQIVELGDARLKFEINDTDGDGGIQVFIDADPWKSMSISDPKGKLMFRAVTKGSFGLQGGTELFMESAEPEFSELSIEELLERFPEGEYSFKGKGLEGETFVGSATLTHNLPAGPVLVSPLEGDAPVDPDNAAVVWESVDPPNGSPIVAYQVLVLPLESPFPAVPKIALDVHMPGSATSRMIPPGFLIPDTEYEWEVLAIEASGNQTLSSDTFVTAAP